MVRKTLRLTCLFFAFAAIISSSLSEAPALLTPIGVRLDTEMVVRGTISEIDCYAGAVVSKANELYFEVDGTILEINALVGDSVAAGDVLLTLDERDIQKQIQKLDERIEYMRASHALDEQIDRLEIIKMQTERKRMAFTGTEDKELALYDLDIEDAQRKTEQMKAQFDVELDAVINEREALFAKTGRDKIVAPCDGRVVFIQKLNPGDEVKAYETVLCVSDDARKTISSEYVSEMNYAGNWNIYALIGEKEYPLVPVPADTKKNLAISLKGGEILSEFEFEAEDPDVEIGQYALVCLESRKKEGVLIVPKNALMLDAAGRFVYRIEDGARVRRPVKIGTMTKIAAEILEGLEEGDEIYVKE